MLAVSLYSGVGIDRSIGIDTTFASSRTSSAELPMSFLFFRVFPASSFLALRHRHSKPSSSCTTITWGS
jgi:hypothetical protein